MFCLCAATNRRQKKLIFLGETRFLDLDLVLNSLKSQELAGLMRSPLKVAGRTPDYFTKTFEPSFRNPTFWSRNSGYVWRFRPFMSGPNLLAGSPKRQAPQPLLSSSISLPQQGRRCQQRARLPQLSQQGWGRGTSPCEQASSIMTHLTIND